MSDVFGSLVKQYSLGQTADQADWLIGQGLLAAGVNGVALRSMKAPGTAYNDPVLGKDPQPAHMKDYVNTISDNGGVHINSGIPNHAFYVVATQIGGKAWEKAGQIWYIALRDKLTSNSKFQDCANLTYQTAADLFGVNSLEQQAVLNGWSEVGIDATATGGGTTPPSPGCLGSLLKLIGAEPAK
jgi:Zn-dependent metalloprotease